MQPCGNRTNCVLSIFVLITFFAFLIYFFNFDGYSGGASKFFTSLGKTPSDLNSPQSVGNQAAPIAAGGQSTITPGKKPPENKTPASAPPNNSPPPSSKPPPKPNNEETVLNLEVVFFDVTQCYVAEPCSPVGECESITDYRDSSKVLFSFKKGTLMVIDKARADSYGYGVTHDLKYCVSTEFSEGGKNTIERYVSDVLQHVYTWSHGGLRIVPHFRSVEADMYVGTLGEDSHSGTGVDRGGTPPPEEQIYYAKKAGVDLKNMDLFVGLTNAFPETDSPNAGLLVQVPAGGTKGLFNGIPLVEMLGYDAIDHVWTKSMIAGVMVHELTHAINIGQYSVSGFEDVYGIQNAEHGAGYDAITNPQPHCYLQDHVVNGIPDPYKYFPDSYYWLDPMFNTKPLEPYPESGAFSYCAQPDNDSKIWPDVNPLDPTDHYEDIIAEGYDNPMKYYKFIYQAHWRPDYGANFHPSFCKNGRFDEILPPEIPPIPFFEFSTDYGGDCFKDTPKCKQGNCFDLGFGSGAAKDSVNSTPIKTENVRIVNDANFGKVAKLTDGSKIIVSGEEFFADNKDIEIDIVASFDNPAAFNPILVNIDRYYLFLYNGQIVFIVNDWYMPTFPDYYPGSHVEVRASAPLDSGKFYKIKAVLKQGVAKLYLDKVEIGKASDLFNGRFVPQSTGDIRSKIYIGYAAGQLGQGEAALNGKIGEVKFSIPS